MTIAEFLEADDGQQYEIICDEGTRLCEQDFTDFVIILYQVAGFYVEMIHEKQKGFFHVLRAFTSTHPLDPYLSQIDISTMLQS